MSKKHLTAREISEYMHWPEYRLGVPKTAMLTCPECGQVSECDVDRNDDAGTVMEQTVYCAQLDTWRCEECGRIGCQRCEKRFDADNLEFCSSCATSEMSEHAHYASTIIEEKSQ